MTEVTFGDDSRISKADELAALFKFTDALYRARSSEAVYEATFNAIREALRCDRASILMFDQDGIMRFVAWRGLSQNYRDAVDGHSPWKAGDRDAAPIFISDIALSEETESLKQTIMGEGLRGLGFIPLMSSGVVIGKFMTYYNVRHEFTGEEARLALTIARQLGFAIERMRSQAAHHTAETGLLQSTERLRAILDSAVEYAIITLDDQGMIASWNAGAERLLGYAEEDVLGQSGEIFFSSEDRENDVPEQEMMTARTNGRATNERWHYRKDGSRFWGSGVMLPVAQGGPDAYLKIFRDRTEERNAEKRRKLLVGELNHRVKNTLATIQSLAEQTLKSSENPAAFTRAFNNRLQALACAHDLLTRESWQSVQLHDISRAVLQAWVEDGRISLQGSEIRIAPKQALALAMALNELLTNAIKYGGLSTPSGSVSLSWDCNPDCVVSWEERGGPPVEAPQRQGFGLRVLNKALGRELGRPVELLFTPTGVVCRIHLDSNR